MLYVYIGTISSPLCKRLTACVRSSYQLAERSTLSTRHDVDLFSFYVFVNRIRIFLETGLCN